MSTFLSYSERGAKVGGFRPLAVADRGAPWRVITDNDCNTPAFLNGSGVVIFQQGAYINEGRTAFLKTTDGRVFQKKASRLFAGGDRWCASYEEVAPGLGATRSTACIYDGMNRTIYGDPRPDHAMKTWGAGQHAVGFDGTLAYCPRYHDGRTVIVEDAEGRVITRGDNIPVTSCSVIDRNAVAVFAAADIKHVWFWNGSLWSHHALGFACYEGHIFRWRGEIYVTCGSEWLCVHKLTDASKGWTFGASGQGYNGNGWAGNDDELPLITWSHNAGASLVWQGGAVVASSIYEVPLAGEAKAWPRPTYDKFNHKAVFASYDTHSERYGNTARFIGSAAFPDKATISEVPSTLPLVAAFDTYRSSYAARYRYYYLHCAPAISDGKVQFDFFKDKPKRDYLIYLDNRNWPTKLPTWVPSYAILCGQAYINWPGESVAAFENAMVAMFSKMAKFNRPMGITTCHYDRGGLVPPEVLTQLTDVWVRLIRKFHLAAVQPFSDMRKGKKVPSDPNSQTIGGMVVYPVLYDEAKLVFDCFPKGLPSFVPDEPDPPEPEEPDFFPQGTRFLGGSSMVINGMKLAVDWDSNIHRPIYKYLRNDPSDPETVHLDRDAPGEHEQVEVVRQPTGKVGVRFVASQHWLTVTPMQELQTRPPDHVVQVMEEFIDEKLHTGGAKTLIHTLGLTFVADVPNG